MAFAPTISGTINAVLRDGSTVYVGGVFTSAGGVTGLQNLCRYDLSTGAVDSGWKPQTGTSGTGVASIVMAPDKSFIFIGAVDNSAVLTRGVQKWSTSSATRLNFMGFTNGSSATTIKSLHLDGDSLYVGGTWTTVRLHDGTTNTTPRGLVKIDITANSGTGGLAAGFTAPGSDVSPESIAWDNDFLYVVGAWSALASRSGRIMKYNKSNGAAASGWPVGVAAGFSTGTIYKIVVGSDGSLYAGGTGASINYGGTNVAGLTKISKAGVLDTSFTTTALGTMTVQDIVESGGSLYVSRRTVSGLNVGNEAAVLKNTNGLSGAWVSDASFSSLISSNNAANGTRCIYDDGLNLFLGLSGTGITYTGNSVTNTGSSHYAISKTSGAVVELQSDVTAPTVVLSSETVSQNGTTATSPVSMTATFSESVTGFTVGDVTVSGGTAGGFSGSGSSYAFTVTPSGQGAVSVSIASGVCQDAAGNQNQASSAYEFTYDSQAPTVVLSAVNAATNAAVATGSVIAQIALTVSVSFSEAVTGVAQGDFAVSGGTISNFSVGSGGGTFTLTPSADGVMTVKMTSGSCQDSAGNGNSESNTLSFTVQSEPVASPIASIGAGSIVRKGVLSMSLSKSALAGLTDVAQNQWKRVLFVYESAGKPNVVPGFKPSLASPSSRFRANINSAASYQLQRVIILKSDGTFVRILRAAIPSASQYDISVT